MFVAGDSGAERTAGATRTVYVTRIVHAIPVYKIRGPRDAIRVFGHRMNALDFAAQEQARALVVSVEACWADAGDFTLCDSKIELDAYPVKGLVYGSSAGQAAVASALTLDYAVTAYSRTGNTFSIRRDPTGNLTRTCTSSGNRLCRRDGSW